MPHSSQDRIPKGAEGEEYVHILSKTISLDSHKLVSQQISEVGIFTRKMWMSIIQWKIGIPV